MLRLQGDFPILTGLHGATYEIPWAGTQLETVGDVRTKLLDLYEIVVGIDLGTSPRRVPATIFVHVLDDTDWRP